MKKGSINLLINREDYQKYENIFENLKILALVLAIFMVIVFVYFYFSLSKLFKIYEQGNLDKKKYLQLLSKRTPDEAKINFIQKKYAILQKYLKEDASSSNYYEVVSEALKNSSESASLKSLEVDKSRTTSFTVVFTDFTKMMEFLKFAEDEIFLKNFETITLKNLVIAGRDENNENYELSFEGRFVPLN